MSVIDVESPGWVLVEEWNRYCPRFTERFSKWGSVEDAFQYWGERVKQIMDETQGTKLRARNNNAGALTSLL